MENLEQVLKDIQDHLAPRLDVYEQAIDFYLFRHTRLLGLEEAVVGFKRRDAAWHVVSGKKGSLCPRAQPTKSSSPFRRRVASPF